jgi:hypothetical protein
MFTHSAPVEAKVVALVVVDGGLGVVGRRIDVVHRMQYLLDFKVRNLFACRVGEGDGAHGPQKELEALHSGAMSGLKE